MADVTLLDGRTVDSCSREWMLECFEREKEARSILDLPKEERRAAIDAYGRRHGAEAQRRLEENIRLVWGLRTGR